MITFQNTQTIEPVSVLSFNSPLGKLFTIASINGVSHVSFSESSFQLPKFRRVTGDFKQILESLESQMTEYFEGRRMAFDILLSLNGTPFQDKVWRSLQDIPFGETRSYTEQTSILGNLKTIRAVASANGKNPIAIVVPCHRVVGNNGNLTGYLGGLWRKQWLLEHEQRFSKPKGQLVLKWS